MHGRTHVNHEKAIAMTDTAIDNLIRSALDTPENRPALPSGFAWRFIAAISARYPHAVKVRRRRRLLRMAASLAVCTTLAGTVGLLMSNDDTPTSSEEEADAILYEEQNERSKEEMNMNPAIAVRATAKTIVATALALGNPAMAEAQNATGNVFADALFWYSGAHDANNDKMFDTGDMRDVRHFADASHALNQCTRVGGVKGCTAITNMPVTHVHACFTNMNETCLYLKQPVDDSEDPKILPAGIRLPDLFQLGFQSNFSAVVRFRWEGPTRTGGNTRLLSLGYDGTTTGGMLFGMDGSGNLTSYFSTSETLSYSTDATYAIHPGVWVDVAIVVENGVIRTYRIMEDYNMANGMWYKKTVDMPTKARTDTTSVNNRFAVGYDGGGLPSGARTYSAYRSAWSTFRGQIQQVAIWDRALTDAEVAEVFGCQSEKLRIGVPDGSSDEFAGNGVSGTVDKPEDWRNFTSTLTEENPSVSFSFTLGEHEANLPQNVSILSTPSSAEGYLSVAVNGQPVSARFVNAGVVKNIFIKNKFFREAVNALTLTWQGTGTFKLDALAVGGSWQVGMADSSYGEFSKRNKYRKTYYQYGPQTWAGRCNNGVATDTNYEDNTIVFNVTAPLASGEHVLEIPCCCSTSGSDPLELKVSVNGVEKTIFNVLSRAIVSPNVLKLTLADGDIVAGANFIELRNVHETAGTAIVYDYIRLTARSPLANFCIGFK